VVVRAGSALDNHSKQAFRPSIGGGKDYFHNHCAAEDCVNQWSMRWQVDYTLKGAEHVDPQGCTVPNGQCTNDLQGPMLSLYMPSPALARHVFWGTIGDCNSRLCHDVPL
jgi:hypothetical protein